MQPTEKALRAKIERLEGLNADLSTQNDVLSEHNEQLAYDKDRYFEAVSNIKQLLGFCEQVGAQPTVEILRDCLQGKHLSLLMQDLSIPTMDAI